MLEILIQQAPPTKTIIKKINSDGSVGTGGKQLALRRFEVSSTANNSTAPHRTLKVGYQVWDWNGTETYTNRKWRNSDCWR